MKYGVKSSTCSAVNTSYETVLLALELAPSCQTIWEEIMKAWVTCHFFFCLFGFFRVLRLQSLIRVRDIGMAGVVFGSI